MEIHSRILHISIIFLSINFYAQTRIKLDTNRFIKITDRSNFDIYQDIFQYEYTFMAILVKNLFYPNNTTEYEEAICGASIIHTDWAITAAKCFEKNVPKQYLHIYTGITDLDVENKQQKRQIKNILIHPKHRPFSLEYNIAMIEISDSFLPTAYVSPGYLPSTPLISTELTTCYMMGFVKGYNNYNRIKTILTKIELRTITARDCMRKLNSSKSKNRYHYSDKNYCVQIENPQFRKTQGACEGDTGSPIVCNYKIQGVFSSYTVSHANETCYNDEFPSVVIDVGHHIGWIHKNIIKLNVIPKNLSVKNISTVSMICIVYRLSLLFFL